jgi:hypothetical protein
MTRKGHDVHDNEEENPRIPKNKNLETLAKYLRWWKPLTLGFLNFTYC